MKIMVEVSMEEGTYFKSRESQIFNFDQNLPRIPYIRLKIKILKKRNSLRFPG
jgi:hypothetical protein